MKGLIHKLGQRCASDRGECLNTYRAMLYDGSEAEATDEQAAELERVMKVLGKTPQDVQADAAAVQEYRRWSGLALTAEKATADTAAAWRAIEEHNAEWQRLQEEHRRTHNRLTSEHMQATAAKGNAEEAGRRAATLYAKHPDVLAGLATDAASPCVYRITYRGGEGRPESVPDGMRGGVYFQGGVGYTTNEAVANDFHRGAYDVECVETHPAAPAAETRPAEEPPAAAVVATAAEPSPEAPPEPATETPPDRATRRRVRETA